MNQQPQRILSPLALLLALPGVLLAQPTAPPPESPAVFLRRMQPDLDRDDAITKITAEMKTIVLPKLELRDATFQETVDYLNTWIHDHNARPSAFQIPPLRIRTHLVLPPQADASPSPAPPGTAQTGTGNSPAASPSPAAKAGASPVAGAVDLPDPPESPSFATISLSLPWIPLPEVLRYVTNLEGEMVDIEPDGIWLKPLSYGTSYLVKHVYIVPPGLCSTKAEVEKIVGQKSNGFDPHAITPQYWEFDEKSHLLTVQYGDYFFPGFELRYARALLKQGFQPSDAGVAR